MAEIQSMRFNHYKSFNGENNTEIGMTDKVSLIIGRNNSGKSSVIDAIEFLYNNKLFYKNRGIDLYISGEVTKDIIPESDKEVYNMKHGYMYDYKLRFLGMLIWQKIQMELSMTFSGSQNYPKRTLTYSSVEKAGEITEEDVETLKKLSREWFDYNRSTIFRRINAERNIVPEVENSSSDVDYNGTGATNLIRKFINDSSLDERKVEQILLDELNKIMGKDAIFEEIRVQQVQDGDEIKWEIFLKEKGMERFALSKSGSGLKTIILVLINLFLIPEFDKFKSKYIYAFEELENNLHPALQRRLFDYLYEYAQVHNVQIFLTSHSHVAINTFYGKQKAQVYHVIKERSTSSVKKIDTYFDKAEILNDLDVKASDLFQSNGIIWVEGPSDRVYIKQWLSVFCNCEYEEGKDYQFLYYGGRLLSHYEASGDSGIENLISILTTNRNAAIVIDSDMRKKGDPIIETKKRIQSEFTQNGYFCWITSGKEIENYITAESINNAYESDLKNSIRQFQLFPKYIETVDKNFSSHKVDFARKVSRYITAKHNILDLKNQIQHLYDTIKSWNDH